MLEVIRLPRSPVVKLMDFGCGASHLYEHILATGVGGIEYMGLDLSPNFVELSRKKFPHNRYICTDILEEPEAVPSCDYIVMNGVFTEKRGLTFDEMLAYFQRMLTAVFSKAQPGNRIQCNVQARGLGARRSVSSAIRYACPLSDRVADAQFRDSQRLWLVRVHDLCLPLIGTREWLR